MDRSTGTGTLPVVRTLERALHALFVLLLAVGAVRGAQDSPRPALVLVGSVLLLAWYVLGVALAARRPGSARPPRVAVGWLAGLVLGWAALLPVSAELSWVAFALFFLALHLLPRAVGTLLVVVVTGIVVAVQLRRPGVSPAAVVLGPTMGAVVALGVSGVYDALRRESEQRRRLNAELLATQDDLLATHEALAGAQRESGVLAERSRLARDVHDTLAQSFSSIVLLARAGLAGEPDPQRLTGVLRTVEETAATGLADARTVVHALTPTDLAGSPLPKALARLVDRQSGSPEVTLRLDGEQRPLPPAVETTLLRVAQGALANVRQHAGARQAVLTLGYGADEVTLDVRDDGRGFDPSAPVRPGAAGGFGLRAITDRARELGGHAEIESAPGEGTVVHVRLPLAQTGAP